jgi:hypothetical protein
MFTRLATEFKMTCLDAYRTHLKQRLQIYIRQSQNITLPILPSHLAIKKS